jgi:antitoxin component HigA of HigAB toxin-antitoxin module
MTQSNEQHKTCSASSEFMTHAEKLKRIETLMASPDVIELDALSADVEAFENEAYPISLPTIPEAMRFRREQMGETQKEISNRAGMSLAIWRGLESGDYRLSLKDARKLFAVGIPASVILGQNAE